MKKKYLVILLTIVSFQIQAQEQKIYDYSEFDTSDLKTELFIKSVGPLSALKIDATTYGMYNFTQSYKEIVNNDTKNRYTHLKEIQRIAQKINYSHIVKIGFLHTEFEFINKKMVDEGKVKLIGNKVVRNTTDYIFKKHTTTILSPLCTTHKGLATTFILDKNYFINNTKDNVTEIKIDFGNGNGYQKVAFNTPIKINYNNKGLKKLNFLINLSNGSTIERHSTLNIEYSKADNSRILAINATEVISSITADLSMYSGATNFAGLAEYEIFLGADNVLDKPIFVIDGFDPGDSRDIAAVYNLLSYDDNGTTLNLADRIRTDEDFDIIIVNLPQYFKLPDNSLQSMANSTDVNADGVIDTADYPGSTLVDGGADFIERNAMIFGEIITIINGQKIGTEQNVVIGPSMGGLITRYALNYMEQNSYPHDTRLWISFDSPHRGANTPIGFQQVFNFLAYGLGSNSVDSVKPIVDDLLKSAAARQMLVDHFEPHLPAGEPDKFDPNIVLPTPHDFHATFYNKIEALTTSGFPETTRNVAISNGSGIGTPYFHKDGSDVLPANKILDVNVTQWWPDPDLDLDVWCTPYAGNQLRIGEQYIDMPWPIANQTSNADSKAFNYSNGVDAAMGGLFDLAALDAQFNNGTDATIAAFFNGISINGFNFIPVVSALALNDINLDWFENINLGTPDTPWDNNITPTSSQTPFVNWFMPDNNENHVTLTTANVDFTWLEIVNPTVLGVNQNQLQDNSIALFKNPVRNQITLQSTLRTGMDLQIAMYDLSGKKIYNLNKKAQAYINIPTTAATGIYLITVQDDNHNILLNTKVQVLN